MYSSYFQNLAANLSSTKHFCTVSYKRKTQSLKHPSFESCSGPANVIQLKYQANYETVALYCTCSTVLEVQTLQKALVVFLLLNTPFIHKINHITVLRQYQLLYELCLEQKLKRNIDTGVRLANRVLQSTNIISH